MAREVRAITVREQARVDLTEIHRAILANHTMKHPPIGELHRIWDEGMAAALEVDGRIAGFAKLTERPSREIKERLGVDAENMPRAFEIGGALILEEYRGMGLYAGLRNGVLGLQKEGIVSGEVLILGATVTVPVLMTFKDLPEWMQFTATTTGGFHEDLPAISAVLCSCGTVNRNGDGIRFWGCPTEENPDHPSIAARVEVDNGERKVYAVAGDRRIDLMNTDEEGLTRCAVVYVSDMEVAERFDNGLREPLGIGRGGDANARFREALRDAGHYDL